MNTESSAEMVFNMAEDLTIYSVAELKDSFMEYAEKTQELKVTLEQVTEFDSAGFQLMMFIINFANATEKTCVIKRLSKPVIDVLMLLGMNEDFSFKKNLASQEASL